MLMSDQPNPNTAQRHQTKARQDDNGTCLDPMPHHAAMDTNATPSSAPNALNTVASANSPQHVHPSLSVPAVATTATPPADPMATTPEARKAKRPVEIVSHATVDALGDYLDSVTNVHSFSAIQEQRRKESYKSGQLVNKTMRQSQQERRRQALLEQTKRRHQLVNHARRLALFSSEGGGNSSSDNEGSSQDEEDTRRGGGGNNDDSEEEEEEEEDEEDDDDEDEEDNSDGARGEKATRKKMKQRKGDCDTQPDTTAGNGDGLLVIHRDSVTQIKQKRRLSSGSESESTSARKGDMNDMLSPKKPRLQRPSPKPKKKSSKNPFRDQLMIPEPMTEIPEDLDVNYYIIPIPTGHRCFLISSDGRTTARLPTGQLLVSAFESCLPAGSTNYKGNRKTDYCILDCVYSPKSRTFWTLDIMCWRGHPVYECETEFRFWWLRGKLAEIESLQQKWIKTQTREFEAEEVKRRQKWTKRQERNARRLRWKQEKERLQQQQGQIQGTSAVGETLAKTTDAISISAEKSSPRQQGKAPVATSMVDVAMDDDDDDDGLLSDTGMELEDLTSSARPSKEYVRREFWPISFTPLPYFNASMDLVRLLAESMYAPSNLTLPTQQPSTIMSLEQSTSASTPGFSSAITPASDMSLSSSTTTSTRTPPGAHLGTMALSGEIAEAAALFPAHDLDQRRRQDQTLLAERAAGLAFYNKKTMYVLGMTPLCGWVAMDQIGDVFFGEEGGVGPVPGTSAVEGREIEMEGALERITLSV